MNQNDILPPTSYVIDFDSTLVTIETLDELARLALVDDPDGPNKLEQLKQITNLGMSGDLGFGESLRRRLKLLTIDDDKLRKLNQYLADYLSPSAIRQKAWFENQRENIYVISGGFEEYIRPVVKQLGIDPGHVYANRFCYDEYQNVIGHDTERHTAKAGGKAQQVRQLELPGQVIVIGDGFTDYEIKQAGAADEFWAYTETVSRPSVTKVADRIVTSFDELAQ